ncbi:telomeric repeat binding factor a [Brachionichthys hirsutus]|uniref:telomeric repeat binding factor a n=1 Tax=Brachionichthys hirsutus TaxID=412623 RepID=UPI0036050B79
MAAKESVKGHRDDIESVVNHWLLEYYYSVALDVFQNEDISVFLDIRKILEVILERPLENSEHKWCRIRVLQFLSRIHDGENLDVSFESDDQISPLESALSLLGMINEDFSIPLQDFDNVSNSLKVMMVTVLIKHSEFGKAEKALKEHFPKPMVGKKAILMGLIRNKTNTHKVIEQLDFQTFKEEMLIFCQKLCPMKVPFLHTIARKWLHERLEHEQDGPGPTSALLKSTDVKFPRCNHGNLTMSKLKAAYMDLAAGSDDKSFDQLNEEVKEEQQAEVLSLHFSPSPATDSAQNDSFRRSGSPLEASLADEPPQKDDDPQMQAGSLSKTSSVPRKRRLYTVARLVVEPDSQVSLRCTDIRSGGPPESATRASQKELQNPETELEVSMPKRKHSRRARRISSSEEELRSSEADKESRIEELHDQSTSPLKRDSKSEDSSDAENPQSLAPCNAPAEKPQTPLASDPLSKQVSIFPDNADEVCIIDYSLDSSPSVVPVPQKSSTPQKDSAQDQGTSRSKWKQLLSNAKESKETWSDEETHFTSRQRLLNDSTASSSSHRKRMWTDHETQKLKEGVKRFGEGNWTKILAYYSLTDRTNVQIKDRWRTMKKLNMI